MTGGEQKKRVVLAYSGGLDTTCILKWLIEEGYEVVAFLADVGRPDGAKHETEELKQKALAMGAVSCHVIDVQREFVKDFIYPAIRANAKYEGKYLLGTSVARPIIAKAFVKVAHQENCQYLSHGATGKGNDQVRFELHANALDPTLKMIAPWRDPKFFNRFEGRQALLDYAAEQGVKVDQTKKDSWSMDENLYHISYESGILEDPNTAPPKRLFRMTVDPRDAPDAVETIKISFEKGDAVKVENVTDGTVVGPDPLELFMYLNRIGSRNGIGRCDIVENRFVGIKSRGVYETPGGTILMQAHEDLEGLTMDREVRHMRDQMSLKFAELAYNGFWYSPEMDFVMSCIDRSQEMVDGVVTIECYKGNVTIIGRESPLSLYNEEIASMDVAGDYDPTDAEGFIHINAVRLKAYRTLLQNLKKNNPERLAQFTKGPSQDLL